VPWFLGRRAQTKPPGLGNTDENTSARDRYSILRTPFNKIVMAFFAEAAEYADIL